MNLQEAYSILEVSSDTKEEDLNKKFRKLAAKYHPDVNKDAGAEEMSKKINAAYNLIKEHKNKPAQPHFDVNHFKSQVRAQWHPFSRVNDIFTKINQKEILEIKIKISFKDSITGCDQKISYQRDIACKSCTGQGTHLTDSCNSCSGKGYTLQEQSVLIGTAFKKISHQAVCFDCEGTGKNSKDCTDCHGSGELRSQTSLNVHIPPGIPDGQKMRLEGQGHHVYRNSYAPAILNVEVASEENMRLSDRDVISNLEVSLLEAIKGGSKTVRTVYGDKTLDIPSGSRNQDRIAIPGTGVAQQGDHIFILDVKYPSDLNNLAKFLEEEN